MSQKYGGNSNAQKYYNLLKIKLEQSDFSFIQREELDRFAAINLLTVAEAVLIENDVRLSCNIKTVNWDDELRKSIRKLLSVNLKVSKAKKLALINTYVRVERLSASVFEVSFKDEKNKYLLYSTTNVSSLFKRNVQVVVGVIAISMIGFSGFYFNSSKNKVDVEKNISTALTPKSIVVSGAITFDTTWRAGTAYILSGPVFVEGEATLTIEPGTRIRGGFESGLIITKNAKINARGKKEAPIVFTSANPDGEKKRGDWGGIVLLGKATINQGVASIEGVSTNDIRGQFGGNDDNHNCGILEYVRIEFAGLEVFKGNELNGLTMGGCGKATTVNYVQVHQAYDDGIEMFGGTADLKNIVITGARDDSLDWDMGWRGRVQFMVIQQYNDAGDNGFEADNWRGDHQALPRSNPIMYNVTMIGADKPDKLQRAMNLRRGSGGEFHNFIVTGYTKDFLDIRDNVTEDLARSGKIQFNNSIVFDVGENGDEWFLKNNNSIFSEKDFINSQNNVVLGLDPLLIHAQRQQAPNFSPALDSPVNNNFSSVPGDNFWSADALYTGAIKPGEKTNGWLDDWVNFSKN